MICRRSLAAVALASCLVHGALGSVAAAAPTDSAFKEASKHFQRGVTLYNEADYRAALVEFRRAYEIAPNAAVLYNLGQTYYQLQNYAAALVTLERYLTESPPNAGHRREVEQTIDTLGARVGKIAVTTDLADCEITVDDELVGRTPLGDPLVVSIGRRKVTAMRQGRAAETRFVDVAAGDTVKLSLSLIDANGRNGAPGASAGGLHGRDLITPGWIATGVFGAAAITTGALAYLASRDLREARTTYPSSRDDLDRRSSRVVTLSAVADILAAATVLTGGITLTLTWSRSHAQEVRVAATPNAVLVSGSFP
jgi:tetratricopeptide (TPR) repeat protein